jgi:hypothetical protein
LEGFVGNTLTQGLQSGSSNQEALNSNPTKEVIKEYRVKCEGYPSHVNGGGKFVH